MFMKISIVPSIFIPLKTITKLNITTMNTSYPIKLIKNSNVSFINIEKQMFNLLHRHQKEVTATTLAKTLINYLKSTINQNVSLSLNLILTITEIDDIVGQINVKVIINTTNSFLMATSPYQNNDIILGVSFQSNLGGQIIRNSNQHNIINSKFTAAAVISPDSLIDVTHITMLIIDKPVYYHHVTSFMNKKLISSIIVAKVQRNRTNSNRMNISLYFAIQSEYTFNDLLFGNLTCSYYNTSTFNWDESGCTLPVYNSVFNNYVCNCNHLTTFALLFTADPSLSTSHSSNKPTTFIPSATSTSTISSFGSHSYSITSNGPTTT
ncbi:unnamed protein product, partial [Rotaria sp. Silwood2]